MTGTITVKDLHAAGLDDHFATLDAAIERYRSGATPNVAIVSEPFGGREALVEYVTDELQSATHVTFPPTATAANLPAIDDHDVLVLSDCHALFTRHIGGFDVLDTFLESVAVSDTFVITAWNEYAWSYLKAVRDIDESFASVVPDPSLSTESVAALIRERYGPDLPTFVETGAAGRVKSIGFDTYPLRLAGRTVSVPVPELNLEYLTTSRDDVETVVFRKIALLSNGNPGIATVLWERSVTDGAVAPAYVEEFDRQPDLDDVEAFVLWTILANDSRSREDLATLFADIPIDRAIQTLRQQGLVAVDGEMVSVLPESLYASLADLRRRRLVW